MAIARVMIVEDDAVVAADVAQRVERLGYEIAAVVDSGRNAVTIAAERPPDVALLDIALRGKLNGIGTAQQLRESIKVPVVYLVGLSDLHWLDRADLPSPVAFVVKPPEIHALRSNLELVLRLNRTERALASADRRLSDTMENVRAAEDLGGFSSWTQDLATGEVGASKACLLIHGLDPQAGVRSLARLWGHVQSNDRARLEAVTQRARERGEPYTTEYRISPPGQGERVVKNWTSVQRDSSGRPQRLIAITQDITEQKRAEDSLRESEARASRLLHERDFILENSRDVLYYIDSNGVLYYISPVVEQLTGIPPEDWKGDFTKHLVDSPRTRKVIAETFEILRTGREYPPSVLEFRKKDGGILYAEIHERPVIKGGVVMGLVGVARDVTERLQAEWRLRQAAAVFENTHEAILITDAERRITAVNRSFTHITGYSEAEVSGLHADFLASGDEPSGFRADVWNAVAKTGRWAGDIWNRRKSGEPFPAWAAVTQIKDHEDRVINHVIVMYDLSFLKEPEERLDRLAHYDPLTRLPNRILFNVRLLHAIRRAEREHSRLAVMFLDLDRFKTVNDTRGHLFGDRLLREVANRLSHCLRKEDTVARLSGDEFAIILEDVSGTRFLAEVARKALGCLSAPYRLDGGEIAISASLGISIFPRDGREATELLDHADAAMFRAKQMGRGRFQFYSHELAAEATARISMESAIRDGLQRGEFVLHYQPEVSLATGRVTGVEALIRWRHPQRGLILPGEFIGLGEETGLIFPLGNWILRTACSQVKAWFDAGAAPITLAVNISARELAGNKNLVQTVTDILEETQFSPTALELEITESAIMRNADKAVDTIGRLRSLGISVAIDDFGTGYSSMAYMRKFSVNKLKTDISFVHGLTIDPQDRAITEAIIGLGHSLGIKVLAEGVESAEQQSFLREHGCDEMQGYLFSPPLPEQECMHLLQRRH